MLQRAAIRLVSLELWIVASVVALSVFSVRLLPIALIIAAAFWPLRWIAQRHLSVRTPVDAPIIVLILLLPVTLWATSEPATTIPQVMRLLTGIALFYTVVNWTTDRQKMETIFVSIMIAGFVLALVSPISVAWSFNAGEFPFIPISLYSYLPRLTPFAINPNIMAGQLVVLLPFPLAFVLFSGRRTGCWLLILADTSMLLMISMLVVTQSRGAILALFAIIAVVFILRWSYGWLMLPVIGIVGIVIGLILGNDRLHDILVSSGIQSTADKRFEIWNRAWYIIQDFPFTGVGMGTYNKAVNLLYPFFINDPTIPHAHNIYLQIAVDLGILGLVAWLALVGTVLLVSWRVYRHGYITGDRWLTGVGLGMIASQVALLVHGLTDNAIWADVPTAALTWGLWGYVLAVYRKITQQGAER